MTPFLAMLAAVPSLQGGPPSYLVLAEMVDGRLAFVAGEGGHDCISVIRVTEPGIAAVNAGLAPASPAGARAGVWMADGASLACKARYPVFYGAPLPGMKTVAPAAALRPGQAYKVSVMGAHGAAGSGCFRVTFDGRAENLPEHRCANGEAGPEIVEPAQPRADPQSYVRADDYPASALRNREEGNVAFALEIGANGRVTACMVTGSSGSGALDSTTCRIMRGRARFTPAVDSTGMPAPWRVEQEVSWTLPAGGSAAPEVKEWGYGMKSNSYSPPAVTVQTSPIPHEPIMAIPQSGPGEAMLVIWEPGMTFSPELARFPSIPDCRNAKARLQLRPDQRAYCVLAPKNEPDLGIH
jgi:TonB family protein